MNNLITEDILINNGFEYLKEESESFRLVYLQQFGITDYKIFRKWIEGDNPIKLDIDNGWTNSGRKWSVHVDNDTCQSIGYADIDTVEQFNKLMEIFDSNFRL